MNPLPNWGPMMRAKASRTEAAKNKRERNQGKYSKRKLSDANGKPPSNKKQASEEESTPMVE